MLVNIPLGLKCAVILEVIKSWEQQGASYHGEYGVIILM